MIKKIILSACLLFTLVSFAQESASSPYSFYGIGELMFKGTVENRSMAGVAVEQDSIHINLENPASFANLALTSFTVGATYNGTKLQSNSKEEKASRTTLDYLAVGLPLGKLGVGFGLVPYSSVGYKIQSLASVADQNNSRYNGSGGLNKAFVGAAYKITPNFNVGADVNYNFGTIKTNNLEYITGVTLGSRELSTSTLSGVNFNLGAMYKRKITPKLNFYSSINYSLESTLNSKNTRNIATVFYNYAFDTTVVDVLLEEKTEKKLTFPSKLSLSAGVGESRKWLVGGKVAYQKATAEANTYNAVDNVGYGRYGSISLGGYFIPNYASFNNYLERIVYRGGFRYEKTGLMVNSKSINDMAITVGVGMPITGSFSNVNVGLELGRRGTAAAGLVREDYANISVGLSFNDKWFQKRKFD
ncbi:hypothetical protein [Flavobacterium crassostreae]|uniref:Aromatic hydrocarbon degradation protein n=1 Tax=Flavobacterium crassostreae TaxID=1763534 RepID=A0A1B9DZU3_9FLAO|nr:hypothetical protein [Flavobacterium crassostreae]OCB75216.1 hypothetical protein LPBF_09155 [Flavobacterium crassostreae]